MITSTIFYCGSKYVPGNKVRSLNNSADVLIDVDGKRQTFVVGWYDFDQKLWLSGDDHFVKLNMKRMKWTFLPLKRLEGKNHKVIIKPA